jgi:hypothetical protein
MIDSSQFTQQYKPHMCTHFVGKISLLLVQRHTSSRMPSAGHQVTYMGLTSFSSWLSGKWQLPGAFFSGSNRQQYKWQVWAAWRTATHLRSLSTVAHSWMDTLTIKKILPAVSFCHIAPHSMILCFLLYQPQLCQSSFPLLCYTSSRCFNALWMEWNGTVEVRKLGHYPSCCSFKNTNGNMAECRVNDEDLWPLQHVPRGDWGKPRKTTVSIDSQTKRQINSQTHPVQFLPINRALNFPFRSICYMYPFWG